MILITYNPEICRQSAPIAWQCLPAECRLLVAELLRSACRPGMTSQKTWHQQNH